MKKKNKKSSCFVFSNGNKRLLPKGDNLYCSYKKCGAHSGPYLMVSNSYDRVICHISNHTCTCKLVNVKFT